MPLNLPNLDDRSYADLVEEALALIPGIAPEWSNHNAADPGITLIELFAYLSELLLYRVNRVSDANLTAFLKLLNGPAWTPAAGTPMADQIRDSVLALRRSERAVTRADFERLALLADARVRRARCVPRRNAETKTPDAEAPGHVSLIIVPLADDANVYDAPAAELLQKIRDYLEPRRLLTTRVHVSGARYVTLSVQLTLVLERDALQEKVGPQAIQALRDFLHPLRGGADGSGWPFGRNVFVSEIYSLLDTQPGVDYVIKTGTTDELSADAARLQRNKADELVAVDVQADELVQLKDVKLSFVTPKLY